MAWAQPSDLPLDMRYPPTREQTARLVSQGWEQARLTLEEALRTSYVPGMGGRQGSAGATAYRQWLDLWRWCELLSRPADDAEVALFQRHLFTVEGETQPVLVRPGLTPTAVMKPVSREEAEAFHSNPATRQELLEALALPEGADAGPEGNAGLFGEWVANRELTSLLFRTLTPEDHSPAVLRILAGIASRFPGEFARYPGLAVAIAVVYDQPPPPWWPHRQVAQSMLPRITVNPADWFLTWVQANEARAFFDDLGELKPSQVKFVVDAPIALTEFEWARKHVRFPKSTFAKAFSSVPYSTPRLQSGAFVWEAPDYTLANIYANGGICVDQAYFAMIAGKARGLPTLFFHGQGSDGGHAWFGYLKGSGRWEMDAGRYENQNYAVGTALDPQTWRPITDHELEALSAGFRDTPEYEISMNELVLAALFEKGGDAALAGRAFEGAVAACPGNAEAWQARGSFLERSGASSTVRQDFHEAALRQFGGQRDLRVHHQQALATLAREEGDLSAADAIERTIVSQNRLQRADLSANAAARRLLTLTDTGRFEEARSEFRRMLASLKATGGGGFFYEVVEPYCSSLHDAGQIEEARKACAAAREALAPSPDSILKREFDKLQQRLSKEAER
jgi:tetratricopeptide (TPR) repeat protein